MALAQDTVEVVRPALSMFTADVGHASLLDTYLSPIVYRGWNVRLGYEHFQATAFNPERWMRQLEVGIDYGKVKNPAGNRRMLSLMGESRFSLMHRRHDVCVPNLQLMFGPMMQLRGGVIYNAANSNNLVSAKLHWAVGANAVVVYNTRFWGHRVSLRYEASMPVVGVFFSPEYDQSYYEIYLGDRAGLVNFGWWGNRFDLTNYVSADWRMGSAVLRVGYRGRIETSWIHGINTHIFTNSLVIGIGGDFVGYNPRKKPSCNTRIVSGQYE